MYTLSYRHGVINKSTTLVKLEGAVRALAEARTLDEVKHVHDIATAAAEYARAARLGLEAQNHAAEIKLRAERKAGELLRGLERATPQTARIVFNAKHDTEWKRLPFRMCFCSSA